LAAKDYLHEWLLLQQTAPNQPQHAAEHRWLKPPQDYTICNVGCAFFSNNSVKGIGLCFKDHTGQFIFASTAWSATKVTVNEAEALGILKALHIAHSTSIPQVRFESDSDCAVNAINSSSIMPNE